MQNTEKLAQILLLSELAKKIQKPIPVIYKNNLALHLRQASVALIFRISAEYSHFDPIAHKLLSNNKELFLDHNKFQEILQKIFSKHKSNENNTNNIFEVLFIQRSINAKDRHSGQIALPGGKCDNDETDYEAVLRETKEEIGLDIADLRTNVKYIGKLNKNFKHSNVLLCSLHIFFDFGRNFLNVSPNEIMDYKWVPAIKLMNISKDNIVLKDFKTPHLFRMFSMLPKAIILNLQKEYLNTTLTTFEIGMKVGLWGFTLEMLMYVLEIFEENVDFCEDKQLKDYFTANKYVENYKLGIYSIKKIRSKFKNENNFTRKYGKIFDLEFFNLVHSAFFYDGKKQKIKEKIDFFIRNLLYLSLAATFLPKF